MSPTTRARLGWAVALPLGVLFLLAGLTKIPAPGPVAARFVGFGYPAWMATLTGLLETTGGVLVLVPRLSVYGAGLLATVMVAATLTHLVTGIGSPGFAIGLLVASILLIALRRGGATDHRKHEADGT